MKFRSRFFPINHINKGKSCNTPLKKQFGFAGVCSFYVCHVPNNLSVAYCDYYESKIHDFGFLFPEKDGDMNAKQ